VDAIDKNTMAGANPARSVEGSEYAGAVTWREAMSGSAVLLTLRSWWILVRRMRRVLQIRTAFEPARRSQEQMQRVYEQVVPTVRRANSHDNNNMTAMEARAEHERLSAVTKAMS
jgi:hypothetical protein